MLNLPLMLSLLIGCGRDVDPTDYKLAGVGLNPDEIGPKPSMYSGFVSYDYIDFAGGSLPLSMVGLSAHDAVSPKMGTFEPPYGMVMASAFFFDIKTPSPDALFGSFAVPPKKLGRCHTVYEPRSYISGISDVGNHIQFKTESGAGYAIGRRPLYYPPDASQVFPTYSELGVFRSENRTWRSPDPNVDLNNWEKTVAQTSNFPFGEATSFIFPGAIPGPSASFSSIPVRYDSGANGDYHQLPTHSRGVKLSWNGPLYNGEGFKVADSGSHEICMQFSPHPNANAEAVENGETTDVSAIGNNCLSLASLKEPKGEYYEPGQMYTGPWDTDDGQVTIQWIPNSSNDNEVVSISLRFLGPIDETHSSMVDEMIAVKKTEEAEIAWDRAQVITDETGAPLYEQDANGVVINNERSDQNMIPEGVECPETGYRAAMPCDKKETVEFVFDPALRKGDGYISSLQGNPFKTISEVTCKVDNANGEFVLSEDIIADAKAYAKQHGATGAIFYINRNVTTELDIPDMRDRIGNKRATAPLLVSSSAIRLGRFWFSDNALD